MSTMTSGRPAKRAGVNIEKNWIASCPGRGELESCPIVAALAGRERLSESEP